MKKTKEPKERRPLSSGEFTKLFIKNFILNSIFVGIVIYIIYEIGKGFLPGIAKTILGFALIFAAIVKIYLAAIKDTFYEGKIQQTDINKISKNITMTFVVILVINLLSDFISYSNSLKFAQVLGMESIVLRNLIINVVINIVMYTVIMISCRVKFLKECENPENII